MAHIWRGGISYYGLLQRSSNSTVQHFSFPVVGYLSQRNYAAPKGLGGKKVKGKLGPALEKVKLPVETDTHKLVNYVCGSQPFKENAEDIQLKDDSEYPEWLWTLPTGKHPPLEELDPNTKAYWKRLRLETMKLNNLKKKTRGY